MWGEGVQAKDHDLWTEEGLCVPNRPRLGDLRKRHSTSWSCTGGQSIDGPISHTRRTGALRPISVERLPRSLCTRYAVPAKITRSG